MRKTFALFLFIINIACSQISSHNVDTITVGLEGSPSILNPVKAGDAYSVRILPLIFNGILKLNPDLTLTPDLAEKIEFNPKELCYTIKLKEGVKFHDGKELTSEDVAFTYRWIMNPDNASPYYSAFREVKKVEILGRYTLKVFLKEPFSPFETALTIGILNSEIAKKDMDSYLHHPVGTGPYMVKEFIPHERIVLERFPDYFGGKKGPHEIIFRVIVDDNTRIMELKKGSVDLLQNSIPPDYIPYLEKEKEIEIRKEGGVNCSYLAFNLTFSPLNDIRVRRAFAHAIDRKAIVKYLLRDTAQVTESLLSKKHWAYNPEIKPYEYDPYLAEKILDDGGYKRKEDNWRFTVRYFTSTNPLRRRIAEVIKHYLEKVGVRVKIIPLEWGTLYSRVNRGSFEIYTMTWVGITEPDIYFYIFHSSSIPPAGANRGRYINPALDRLLEAGRQIFSREERRKVYWKVQEIVHRDLPYIYLWISDNVIAYRKNKGLERFVIYPGGEYTSLSRIR